jgi:hypothetical protein
LLSVLLYAQHPLDVPSYLARFRAGSALFVRRDRKPFATERSQIIDV